MTADKHKRLAAGHPDRAVGLVYLDDTKAAGPATHVLVIGVADYQSKSKFKDPLDTATISARAVADWFIGDAKAHFNNSDCALGSLAIVLSEPPATGRAIYAGGEVPRADFASTRAAVRAWVERINTHKDNLAILYVAAHGESHLKRTAFLLEDYNTDNLDVTAGMSEVEQFVGALENATPVDQLLLFDCCRAATDMQLPWDEPLGTKLIALTRQASDHGETRQQWAIAATALGEYAGGYATGPTLFNSALIAALNGVASDTAHDGWPVRPGVLLDRINSILDLYRLPSQARAQTPTGRAAGSFGITYPGEPDKVPVYVSLQDREEWENCSIAVTVGGKPDPTIVGKADPPFHVLRVAENAELGLDAAELGKAHVKKVRGPAMFVEIKDAPPPPPGVVVGQLPPGRSLKPIAEIRVAIEGPVQIDAGAVVVIRHRDERDAPVKREIVPIGGEKSIEVRPGTHVVSLRTPDGRTESQDVTVAKDEIVRAVFRTQASPHEWLQSAAVAGAIAEPELYEWLPAARMIVKSRRVALESMEAVAPVGVRMGELMTSTLDVVPMGRIWPHQIENDDRRFLRIGFLPDYADARLCFAGIVMGNREERAVLPILQPMQRGDDWRPYLVVDRQAPLSDSLTSVIVESRTWEGLLGFLGSRDMAAGSLLLNGKLYERAVQALREKMGNPLAAAAGALIAVAASHPDFEKRWDPWLENLANFFPGLPDGPIILGRRRLIRAKSGDDLAAARLHFIEGFNRGVPAYSLSVDWMARGFESLPGDDEELERYRRLARQLANRVDRNRPFTVIRIRG